MIPDHRSSAVVIEDDPDIAQLLRIHLDALGVRVRSFATGEAGLAGVREELPDFVVLDVQLPGIDGWDVLHRLRADARTARLPIVLTSVADLAGDRAGPASSILQKPFLRADVRRAVSAYVDERIEAAVA
jgi:DNA-binding response OmpR family regulator